MRRDQLLQLACADVLALPDDDVLPAPGDAERTGRVDHAEVPGPEPAVGGEGLGVERRVAVADEAFGSAREDLPLVTGRYELARLVDEAHFRRADREPFGLDPAGGRIVRTAR